MVAPQYLNLTGSQVAAAFWSGITVTVLLLFTAARIALRGEAKAIQESSMTTAEIGYNIALAAIVASSIAAFKRCPPKSAWIACAIALIGLGADYLTGPPRTFFWQKQPEAFVTSVDGWNFPKPIVVHGLLEATVGAPIHALLIVPTNFSGHESTIGRRIFHIWSYRRNNAPVKVSAVGKDLVAVSEINSVPNRTGVFLTLPFDPPVSCY